MYAIIRLAAKELRKKKKYTLLLFFVCLIAMYLVITAATNASGAICQQREFEKSIAIDMERVLHLYYDRTKETDEFAGTLEDFRGEVKNLPGVKSIGRFDLKGMYFSELRDSEAYAETNGKIVKGGKYRTHPDIARLLRADESILPLVQGGISRYDDRNSGNFPVYVSEVFAEVLPKGTVITDEYTGERYEVSGYFAKGSRWVEENDLIRFPMVSMDGWFVAPFSEKSEKDIMTQLSCLHNTYLLLEKDADVNRLKVEISKCAEKYGFAVRAVVLAEEYKEYCMETKALTDRQIWLAVFLTAMAVSAVVAVFTTDALLKRRQYGILLANGWSLREILLAVGTEIAILVLGAAMLSWLAKLVMLLRSTDLFRDVLVLAHSKYTLPVAVLAAVAIICFAVIIPAVKIQGYKPAMLIGGNGNGND